MQEYAACLAPMIIFDLPVGVGVETSSEAVPVGLP